MSVSNCDERSDERDYGLAAADVALQQTVHRALALQIVDDLLHHALLGRCQLERKDFAHFGAHGVVDAKLPRLLLHLLGRPANSERELKGEELLEDDPAM